MRILKASHLLLAAALLAGMLPLTAAARPPARIEGGLLDRLSAGGTAGFFVKLAVEADTSAANGMDWHARGHYVWDALNKVAADTQGPLLAYCAENGLDCSPMLINNSVFVRGGDLAAANGLAAVPGVAYLRLERMLTLDPAGSGEEPSRSASDDAGTDAVTDWGILDTKADQVWQLGVRGAGVKVASIDTGVQWDHPALIGGFACPGDPANPACWSDPSNICGGAACDNLGHGTHTMGTMVARDGPDLPYIAGMAPEATWIACKGCETNECSESALTSCAGWILAPGGDPDNRPQVVNNSWGDAGGNPWYLTYVQNWSNAGIFPAFSAGNSGWDCGTLGSPGDYQESFASAAHSPGRGSAFFSSRGPSAYGHEPFTKPNVSAPGVGICSTVPIDGWSCYYSGTSMASPHSAGAVALAWSACPHYLGQVDLTFRLIQAHADAAPAGFCGAPPDGQGNYTYGYGYLDALAMVTACQPACHPGQPCWYVYLPAVLSSH